MSSCAAGFVVRMSTQDHLNDLSENDYQAGRRFGDNFATKTGKKYMSNDRLVQSNVVCAKCADQTELGFAFTMAFQPIVNCVTKEIFGYEALVRGLNNEPAGQVISQVNDQNRYAFDQQCRIKAITLAAKLNLQGKLSINFMPKAIYQPERCIRTTLQAAQTNGFPINRIIFEFTETEKMEDTAFVQRILEFYRSQGFTTAIDDFGSGYSGLELLCDFQTKIVKIDMVLIRDIDHDKNRQIILRNILNMFREFNVIPLAEGIENNQEKEWLQQAGIQLMQGFYFAKPGFESLPEVTF